MSGGANSLRIIGGLWRGRKLSFPDIEGLRPTPDRIRETLFNWLQNHISGAQALDLFAGSGALGLEALSRGASYTRFVEKNPKAAQQIREHLKTLGCDTATVTQTEVLAVLQTSSEAPYQVVFMDPPFHQNLLHKTVQQLEQSHWLDNPAWIYIECEKQLSLDFLPKNWQLHRSKTAGQLAYHLYERRTQ